MATKATKPVTREVTASGRAHIATITNEGVTLREKGKRTTTATVPWEHVVNAGAEPTREVMVDGRPHVATFTHEGVYLKEKGSRTEYGPVSWGLIFLQGARLKANETRTERATRRVSRGLLS